VRGGGPLFLPPSHSCRDELIPLSVMGSNETNYSPREEGGGGERTVCGVCNEERLVRKCHVEILVGTIFVVIGLPPQAREAVGSTSVENATNTTLGLAERQCRHFFVRERRPIFSPHFMPPDNHISPLISRSSPFYLLIMKFIARSWICGRRCPPICLPLVDWTRASAWNHGAFLSVSIS